MKAARNIVPRMSHKEFASPTQESGEFAACCHLIFIFMTFFGCFHSVHSSLQNSDR